MPPYPGFNRKIGPLMKDYFRPIAVNDANRPPGALPLAGGKAWFAMAEHLTRSGSKGFLSAADLPADVVARFTAPRADIAGLALNRPRLMGILNVTPDSFSDGGRFLAAGDAVAQARALAEGGADILDIGGESTRPGAADVDAQTEIARTAPVISALRAGGLALPISIDTRKSAVAQAALAAGSNMINDVAAFSHDPALAGVAAAGRVPVCLMHAQGTPDTMQNDPRYANVLLDVYDFLEEKLLLAESAGIARDQVILDPGIGFGKTLAHNLALIGGISLFHGLGCPLLLGASRKRFIGTLSGEDRADRRVPGSVAVALAGAAQGVQFLRVHDITETRQALTLAEAIWNGA